MTWKESIKIGIPDIDRQHKELCDMLDDFYDASIQGRGAEEVIRLLDFLESYTDLHFEAEEQLMQQIKYPHFKKHKTRHDEMRRKVAHMKKEVTDWGATTAAVKAVNEAITAWLIRHIMGFDMDIKKYVK